jgi:hypothetical protein
VPSDGGGVEGHFEAPHVTRSLSEKSGGPLGPPRLMFWR